MIDIESNVEIDEFSGLMYIKMLYGILDVIEVYLV